MFDHIRIAVTWKEREFKNQWKATFGSVHKLVRNFGLDLSQSPNLRELMQRGFGSRLPIPPSEGWERLENKIYGARNEWVKLMQDRTRRDAPLALIQSAWKGLGHLHEMAQNRARWVREVGQAGPRSFTVSVPQDQIDTFYKVVKQNGWAVR